MLGSSLPVPTKDTVVNGYCNSCRISNAETWDMTMQYLHDENNQVIEWMYLCRDCDAEYTGLEFKEW